MKKLLFLCLLSALFSSAAASTKFSSHKGVWSSDSAEAVITDSLCIFYCLDDSVMTAILEIPSAGVSSKTLFTKGGTVTSMRGCTPLDLAGSDGGIVINGHPLKKVEEIKIVAPYEMPRCVSQSDVGKCLQEWRLGAGYGVTDEMIYCEVNTNRHMFVYMVSPSMTYIRAAAARNNNLGTLFFQNIRMMKNSNTDEFTMYLQPDNYAFTRDDIEIDNSKFRPNSCTFDPDGGIYWSYISSEPDLILLNGCGETYEVKRPDIDPIMQYFEYVPYTDEPALKPRH